MFIKVKKIYLGHASIRDYVVKKCIRLGEDLIIEFNGRQKRFPYRSLAGYLINTNKEVFTSKFDGRQYGLIDFPWEAMKDIGN